MGNSGPLLVVGMILVLMLHGFIIGNMPAGAVFEWNLVSLYPRSAAMRPGAMQFRGGRGTSDHRRAQPLFGSTLERFAPQEAGNMDSLICSASTPPGGGAHGMCGYFAAQSAKRSLQRLSSTPPDLKGAATAM